MDGLVVAEPRAAGLGEDELGSTLMRGPEFVTLQALQADAADAYNAFLTLGVKDHPDTLRIAPGDIVAAPFSTLQSPDAQSFLALDSAGSWLGVVSVERERGREKRRHIAWVLRMYVPARNAGRGIGRTLLRAAIAHARGLPGVSKLNLTVAAHNRRAVSLYESEGFRSFAREDDAFRDPEPRAELTMSLKLDD